MHPLPQLRLNGMKRGTHPLRDGLTPCNEMAIGCHRTVVREAKKREGLGFSFPTLLPINLREPTKLDQSRLLRMEFQREACQPFPKLSQNRSASLRCSKPTTRSRVKEWFSGVRRGLSVGCGFPLEQCLINPVMTSSPFPSHPTGRSVFPNPAVRQSSSHHMRRLPFVLDDPTPDIDHASGIQSRIRVTAYPQDSEKLVRAPCRDTPQPSIC
jgi:hypothetical protein